MVWCPLLEEAISYVNGNWLKAIANKVWVCGKEVFVPFVSNIFYFSSVRSVELVDTQFKQRGYPPPFYPFPPHSDDVPWKLGFSETPGIQKT